ncbi:MAG: coiled-coil domain-containing protein, partial [Catenulispora sp.]
NNTAPFDLPPKTALNDPVTVPSPGDGTSVAVLDSSPRYSARTNMDIETVNAKFAEIVKHFNDEETTEQTLEARATSLNTKVDAYTKADAAVADQVKQHNAKVDALQTRIDAHNAAPHVFELPDQQAAADAYEAEANELNGEKNTLNAEQSSIQAEQTKLDTEEGSLSTEKDGLQKDVDSFSRALTALQSDEQHLERDRLNVLAAMAADEEDFAARQSVAGFEWALAPRESPAAAEMAQGGDAPRPADASDPSVQSGSATQPDPAVENSAGGDMPARTPQNSVIDSYAQQHGVTVIRQPVRVRLSPQTMRSLTPGQAKQMAPSSTYQGLVREPSGKYRAIEVVAAGSGYNAGQKAFNDAVTNGGQAHAVLDGRPIVIDAVDTVIDPGPGAEPAPTPSPQSTPTPTPSRNDKHPDCRDEKPAGAADLPNLGWVLYDPLGPNKRGTGMEACLVGYSPPHETDPKVDPAGWDDAVRRAGMLLQLDPEDHTPISRCHFLAARFGGSNDDPRNFTACWQTPVNVGANGMSAAEFEVATGLKEGLVVSFSELADYNTDRSDTPSSYTAIAYGQEPGTSALVPLWSESIWNAKEIDGEMANLGN